VFLGLLDRDKIVEYKICWVIDRDRIVEYKLGVVRLCGVRSVLIVVIVRLDFRLECWVFGIDMFGVPRGGIFC
jgi:hypothetical protein